MQLMDVSDKRRSHLCNYQPLAGDLTSDLNSRQRNIVAVGIATSEVAVVDLHLAVVDIDCQSCFELPYN